MFFLSKPIPEHCSWDRIWAPSNWWLTIFKLGFTQRMKLEPFERQVNHIHYISIDHIQSEASSWLPVCERGHWVRHRYSQCCEASPAVGSTGSVKAGREKASLIPNLSPIALHKKGVRSTYKQIGIIFDIAHLQLKKSNNYNADKKVKHVNRWGITAHGKTKENHAWLQTILQKPLALFSMGFALINPKWIWMISRDI